MKKLTLKEKEEIIRAEYPFADKEELAKKLGYKNATTLRTVASKMGVTKQYEIPDLKNEVWKIHEDFPNFTFSNKGRIKSIERNRLIKQRVHEGYFDSRITNKLGEKKTIRTHRIIAELFVAGKTEENSIVNHKDANKLNNDFENLEWCTYEENAQHALENVTYNYDPRNRLVKDEVVEICNHIQEGLSIKEIMSINPRFTRARVEKIRQRKTHLDITKNYEWKVY